MKRFFTLLMAAVSLMACSRTYEERVELPGEFTATIESIGTKTSMDGLHVLWSSGDQVSVFAGMAINECYQVTKASAGKRSANFTKVGNSEGFGSTIPANVAYYPYASDVEVDWSASEALVYATLPATQTYAAASFGQGVYPMMAVTQGTADKDFAFKNICGVLKLQLTGIQKVKSIAFQGNDNEVICGDAIITSSYGSTPSIQMTGNGKALTLDCGEGVQLTDTPTEFCIVLPPMTFSKGFTVTVTDTDSKSMEIVTSKPQTISRAGILKMPAKEFVGVPEANEPTGELCFTAEEAGSTVSLNKYDTPFDVPQEYCVDGEHWHKYTFGTPIILANVGDKVYFRKMTEGVAEGFSSTSLQGDYYFEMSGLIAASGNVMSLIDKTCQSVAIPSSNCFRGLFEYCSSLTQAPELPATILASSCYFHMFANCTSLTEAPELPATTLTNYCYTGMFMGCTSLTEAPELPATTLKSYCYADMFVGCTSLADAPELPATELADACYHGMFSVCTSLTMAPVLPAKTLKNSCYAEMFDGCTALSQAPKLPATSLDVQCYEGMFNGCTSLTEAPELPATTLDSFCYNCMFQGCTSLTKAPELAAATLAPHCYSYMFHGCTSLTIAPLLPATTLAGTCYSNMFNGCTSLIEAPELPALSLKGFCYTDMFRGCTALTKAPELPATTLAECCYSNMFDGCTTLTESPKVLPATTLAEDCYWYMFNGCISLIEAPELPATTLADQCYYSMFNNCTSLIKAPRILPATTLAGKSYWCMFKGCTSLTETPELPATTLTDYCYFKMFEGCTSLRKAPEALPATTLAKSCYDSMFSDCPALTVAPKLPATKLVDGCYSEMFSGCKSLNEVRCYATDISATYATLGWLSRVASTGTFYAAPAASWSRGDSGIPVGWTVMTSSGTTAY